MQIENSENRKLEEQKTPFVLPVVTTDAKNDQKEKLFNLIKSFQQKSSTSSQPAFRKHTAANVFQIEDDKSNKHSLLNDYCKEGDDLFVESMSEDKASVSSNVENANANTPSKKKKKSNDEELKHKFATIPIHEFYNLKCNSKYCKYGGGCVGKTTQDQTKYLREKIWGAFEETAPTTKQRGELIKEILRSSYDNHNRDFKFIAGGEPLNYRLVCESAYLILIGLSVDANASQCLGQWKTMKSIVIKEANNEPIIKKKKIQCENPKAKYQHAAAYIEHFAEKLSDTSPYADKDNALILPYYKLQSFYEDYTRYCDENNGLHKIRAGETTFRSAFDDQDKVKLLGSKGAFHTCEICNNAIELIGDKKLTEAQRNIIREFQRLHLNQQSNERAFLDKMKLQCQELDEFGQPKKGMIYSDGMTVMTCNTPRSGKFHHNADHQDNVIESRVIGVEVYCGKINTVFLYYTDNLVRSGGNIMLEVQRQALIDLAKLLSISGYRMPREFCFQFDNCGENKNKIIFSYMSLLLESFIFDKISVNFLIVGHTHSSIDQYFSVLSKAIKEAKYIGSPLGLVTILSMAHKKDKTSRRPTVIRQIIVYYDVTKAYTPYINTNIKHHQIPHCFQFNRTFCGRGYMQYKLFSTNTQFLPLVPDGFITTIDKEMEVSNIELPSNYSLMNGESTVHKHFNMNTESANLLKDKKLKDSVDNFIKVQDRLQQLSIKSVIQQEKRMDNEAENGIDLYNSYDISNKKQFSEMNKSVQIKLQNELKAKSSKKDGFIFWLNYKEDLPPISDVCPLSFDPSDVIEYIAEIKRAELELKQKQKKKDDDAEESNNPPAKTIAEATTKKKANKDAKVVLYNSAKKIVATAKLVLEEVAAGKITVENPVGPITIEWFNENHITTEEYNFYKARATVEDVINLTSLEYKKCLQTKWELLPLPELLAVDQERINQKRLKHQREIEHMNKVCSSVLVKMGHGTKETDEIVGRGVGDTALTGARSKNQTKNNNKNNNHNNSNENNINNNKSNKRIIKNATAQKKLQKKQDKLIEMETSLFEISNNINSNNMNVVAINNNNDNNNNNNNIKYQIHGFEWTCCMLECERHHRFQECQFTKFDEGLQCNLLTCEMHKEHEMHKHLHLKDGVPKIFSKEVMKNDEELKIINGDVCIGKTITQDDTTMHTNLITNQQNIELDVANVNSSIVAIKETSNFQFLDSNIVNQQAKINGIIDLLKITVDCERLSNKVKNYKLKLKAVLDFSEYGKYYRNLALALDITISDKIMDKSVNLSLSKNREKFIDEFVIAYIRKFNVE